jgi:hypothetical protein
MIRRVLLVDKRGLAFLSRAVLATALLLGSAGAVRVPSAIAEPAGPGAARLLPDSGFESGLGSWSADPGAVAVGSPVHSGAGAVQITDNSGASVSVRSAPIAVLPGEELTATIWVQQQAAGAGGRLYLEFWRADGTTRSTPVVSAPAVASADWQQLTASGVAPDDAVTARVLAYSAQGDTGTTVWDDAAVTALPPPLRRIPNAGFEEQRNPDQPTEWTSTPAGSVGFVHGAAAHGGHTAVQIDDRTGGAVSVVSRAVPVRVDETITASAWANPLDSSGARLYLEFHDAAGAVLRSRSADVTGSGWRRVTVTDAAPPGTTTLKVLLYGTQAGQGRTRWDDVKLRSSADTGYDATLAAAAPVLFVGDQRVESYAGVSRVVHPGAKGGIVLTGIGGWDGNPRLSGTVLAGGPGEPPYQMWYATTDGAGYVTSTDGITWSRNGRTAPVYGKNSGGVVRNPAWTAGSGLPRYFTMQAVNPAKDVYQYTMLQSADGVTWAPVPGSTPIPGYDVANVTWDQTTGQFVAMTKHQTTPPYGPRTVWVSTSTDFKTWSTPRPAFAADLLDDERIPAGAGRLGETAFSEIYGMPAIRYGDQYLGTPWVFDIVFSPNHDDGHDTGVDKGRSHIEVAASRDLVNWSRPDRTDLITPGAEGTWDYGFALSGTTLLNVRQPDGAWQTRFYYGAFSGEHVCDQDDIDAHMCTTRYGSSNIGLVTWPTDRFESFHAAAAGSLTTRPLTRSGDDLTVNYDPGPAGGSLRVAVLDADGNPIQGYGAPDANPVTADARAPGTQVTWGADHKTLRDLAGPLRLRFDLSGGDLYEFAIG